MSSILDLNSNSSDSEDDQDYIPPTADASDECDDEVSEEESESPPKKIKLDEIEPNIDKKAVDSIWKDFLKGVDNVGHRKAAGLNVSHQSESDPKDINAAQDKSTDLEKSSVPEKALISENEILSNERDKNENNKIVLIEKEFSIDGKDNSKETKPSKAHVEINVAKRAGISSILGAIANKDKKMTVFEKSLLDWKDFKQQEGIGKDLEIYNKSKNGYIERKRFLERSDLRLFETEKSIRLNGRKK